MAVLEVVKAIAQGMALTVKRIPRKPITVQYPDEPVRIERRFRGMHVLNTDENSREKCVGCYLCAIACPADAIYIEAAEDSRPYGERVGIDRRYAKVYNIDYGKCIFCGYCEEACPEDAITMGPDFELAFETREAMIMTKDKLLATNRRISPNLKLVP
jgi:NADH-quinone oxidoreductase subunit I